MMAGTDGGVGATTSGKFVVVVVDGGGIVGGPVQSSH